MNKHPQTNGASIADRSICLFIAGIAGVTGCEPPVDFGPGVTLALFSELLPARRHVRGLIGGPPFRAGKNEGCSGEPSEPHARRAGHGKA